MGKGKTAEKIMSVFTDLMLKYSIEDISIVDIIERANISRTTFYRYFKDKYDLMNQIYISVFSDLLYRDVPVGTRKISAYEMLAYIKQNREYMKKAMRYSGQNSIFDTVYHEVFFYGTEIIKKELNTDELPEDIIFSLKMFCYGSVHLLNEWLENENPPDERNFLRYIIDNIPVPLKRFFDSMDWSI